MLEQMESVYTSKKKSDSFKYWKKLFFRWWGGQVGCGTGDQI